MLVISKRKAKKITFLSAIACVLLLSSCANKQNDSYNVPATNTQNDIVNEYLLERITELEKEKEEIIIEREQAKNKVDNLENEIKNLEEEVANLKKVQEESNKKDNNTKPTEEAKQENQVESKPDEKPNNNQDNSIIGKYYLGNLYYIDTKDFEKDSKKYILIYNGIINYNDSPCVKTKNSEYCKFRDNYNNEDVCFVTEYKTLGLKNNISIKLGQHFRRSSISAPVYLSVDFNDETKILYETDGPIDFSNENKIMFDEFNNKIRPLQEILKTDDIKEYYSLNDITSLYKKINAASYNKNKTKTLTP